MTAAAAAVTAAARSRPSVFEDVSSEDAFRLERIDLAAVDDAIALIVAHARGGVARYATRSDPARFVTDSTPGAMRIDGGGTVARRGIDASRKVRYRLHAR